MAVRTDPTLRVDAYKLEGEKEAQGMAVAARREAAKAKLMLETDTMLFGCLVVVGC